MSIETFKLLLSFILIVVVLVGMWQLCNRMNKILVIFNFIILFTLSYFYLDYSLMILSFQSLIGIILWRQDSDEGN